MKKKILRTLSVFLVSLVFILSLFTLPKFDTSVGAASNLPTNIDVTYKFGETSTTTINMEVKEKTDIVGLAGTTIKDSEIRHVVLSDVEIVSSNDTSNTFRLKDHSSTTFSKEKINKTVKGASVKYDAHVTGWKVVSITINDKNDVEHVLTEYDFDDLIKKDIGNVIAKKGWYTPIGDDAGNVVTGITVEPVFGRVIYVRSPYEVMRYSSTTRLFDENLTLAALKAHNSSKYGSYNSLSEIPELSSDNNNGSTPELAVATLKGAYSLIADDSTQTVYDNLITICGDFYEVYAPGTSDGTKYNNSATYKNYFVVYESTQSTFGFVFDNKKPATITSLNDTDGKPFDMVLTGARYDLTNRSSLRWDNLNIIKYAPKIHGDGTDNDVNKCPGTQINIDTGGITFEVTETVVMDHLNEVRGASAGDPTKYAEHLKIRGGAWNYVFYLQNCGDNRPNKDDSIDVKIYDFTYDERDLYLEVGGNAYVNYFLNGHDRGGSTGNNFVYKNTMKLIISGGYIKDFYGSGRIANSHVEGDVNVVIYGGYVDNLYGAGYGSIYKTDNNDANTDGNVNIDIYDGKFSYIYGGGIVYTSNVYGNVNMNVRNATINKDIYGGGRGGSITGKVNLMIDNCTIKGSVFGGGFGLTDTITSYQFYAGLLNSGYTAETYEAALLNIYKQSIITAGYATASNIDEYFTKEWNNIVDSFPYYSENGEIILKSYHFATSGKDSAYCGKTNVSAKLTFAEVGGVELSISNSNVTKNIYGGGSISITQGDIVVNLNGNNTVSGSVYGGGDGVTLPSAITTYKPITVNNYKPPAIIFQSSSSITNSDENKYTNAITFNWSNDSNLKQVYNIYDGIDRVIYEPQYNKTDGSKVDNVIIKSVDSLDDNDPKKIAFLQLEAIHKKQRLVYSADIERLGEVQGNVSLNISNNNKLNDVYAGSNEGFVSGSITLNINENNESSISNLYGGSNQADIGDSNEEGTGNITINANGSANENITNLYGGNNASGSIHGDVTLNINNGNFGNIYGGGNNASLDNTITMYIRGGKATNVYGGGNNASVLGSYIVMDAGNITTLFGGGNLGELLGTTITVGGDSLDIASYIRINGGTITTLHGGGNQADVNSDIYLYVYGGNISYLYGGNNLEGNISGDINVNVSNATITGLYGGGNKANYNGNITINAISGTITGIYGGGNQADIKNTTLNVGTNESAPSCQVIYGGGKQGSAVNTNVNINNVNLSYSVYGGGRDGTVTGTATTVVNKGSIGNHVFGAGYGATASTQNVSLTINGGTIGTSTSDDRGNVYSGGNLGIVNGTVSTTINGGEIINNVYGGGNSASVVNANLTIKAGTINGSVFGGGRGAEATASTTTTNITGGSISGIVYGGGDAGPVNGLATTTISNASLSTVYGGGNAASVVNTSLTINSGTFSGNIYGGGKDGAVSATATTNIKSGTISGNVYGGGEGETATANNTDLTISNGTISGSVYGGGNAGAVNNLATTTISNGSVKGNVFGAGFGATASVNNTKLTISGGSFGNNNSETGIVYGGGDAGPVNTSTNTTISNVTLQAVYGGGNAASAASTNLTINSGTTIKTNVYGGGKNGEVSGTLTTVINAGTIHGSVFGGGEGETATSNAATVYIQGGTINDSVYGGGNLGATSSTYVEINTGTITNYVFGGGNAAEVEGQATINMTGGSVGKNLYGAGRGEAASTGKTHIEISAGTVTDSIFGGGMAGIVEGCTYLVLSDSTNVNKVYGGGEGITAQTDYTEVYIQDNTNKISEVYGGGLSGPIIGTISENQVTVDLNNAKVGTVFGGGYDANIAGTINFSIKNGTVADTVYGGNYSSGNIQGSITMTIADSTITEVYGGGRDAKYYSVGITMTIDGTSKIETVYGGGRDADVSVVDGSATSVIVNNGTINTLYGGGLAGDVTNQNVVTINNGNLGNVYGGGYAGDTVNTILNINGGNISGNVYGAGYDGSATTTDINITGSSEIEGSIFGGGYGINSSVTNSNVFVNMSTSLEVVETFESEGDKSGKSKIELTGISYYGYIGGSVYGGGDMGTIGEGYIDKGSNTARLDVIGSTIVEIQDGYIKGSVFGGGNGTPPVGTAYNLNMGTVFGETRVDIYKGRIEGSVFGGGNQSRTYASLDTNGIATTATTVNINETKIANSVIMIGDEAQGTGSIFGGGNTTSSGSGSQTNASIPTTIGNTNVKITGNAAGSKTYILGGVYGDGNLCLVAGIRNVSMKDFTTGSSYLKTFYSLQRADNVVLDNTQIVLKGAIDLVEVGDDTEYSINRVKRIDMKNGSTFKLTTIVKYLGAVTSDVDVINSGSISVEKNSSATRDYRAHSLTEEENQVYINDSSVDKNTICVANGMYLELRNEDDSLGYVEGVFTLALLIATPGEGGGFVYASEESSTPSGDFVCMTKFTDDASSAYMTIVVGVCIREGIQTRYWYIAGSSIDYSIYLNGYIGANDATVIQEVVLPSNTVQSGYNYLMILQDISSIDDKFTTALENGVYDLKADYNLVGQEIAIELRVVNNNTPLAITSLGFLEYSASNWTIAGKSGVKASSESERENVLGQFNPNFTYSLQFVLYKSNSVNTEIMNTEFQIDIEMKQGTNEALEAISGGTTELGFTCRLNIVRLIPVQASFSAAGKQYAGVSSQEGIKITKGSSLTVNTVTRYFPSSYVTNSTNKFSWHLMAGYVQTYYSSSSGRYAYYYNGQIVGGSGDLNNYEIIDGNCVYSFDETTETLKPSTNIAPGSSNFFPQGTMITMIDLSDSTKVGYYYYKVETTDQTMIDLFDFSVMGSSLSIKDTLTTDQAPAFYKQYKNNSSSSVRVTENIVFVFDFLKADTGSNNYIGNIIFAHNYGSIDGSSNYTNYSDIMDYVTADLESSENTFLMGKSNYCTYEVTPAEFAVDAEIDFDKQFQVGETPTFEDFQEIDIIVDINENTEYVDTDFVDNEYSVLVSYYDQNKDQIIFPVGMYIEYRGSKYYPLREGKYIIVPVETAGKHTLTLVSNLSGYEQTGTIKLELYASADGEYYHNINTGKFKELTFQTTERIGTSLNITVDKQIVYENETLTVEVKSDAQDLITFDAYKKDARGNFTQEVEIFKELENIALIDKDVDGYYYKSFTLKEELEPGTYCLVFNNGTAHTERVYIIISNGEFLIN